MFSLSEGKYEALLSLPPSRGIFYTTLRLGFTPGGKTQPWEPLIPKGTYWFGCLPGPLIDLLPQTLVCLLF